MNIKENIRRKYLYFLLGLFTVGSWFGWEYAEEQIEDLELTLNPRFIAAMTKLIKAIDDDPEFLEIIRSKSDTTNLFD